MNTRKRHIIFFGILLFMAAQYSAVVHASAHYFHSPDKLCSVYSAIEHDKSSCITHNIIIPFLSVKTEPAVSIHSIVTTAYFIFLPARAPPRA